VFGEIPGVKIGDRWKNRAECARAGVHRTNSAGIHGSESRGCYSIAISNVYEDDRDFGEIIIYTGEGGRQKEDPETGKRIFFGPQIYDQEWTDHGNLSLLASRRTRKPVRVIRSFKVVSKYAPAEGYRYDGLYVVKDAWQEKNDDDLIICRFRLERCPGQPPL
ncbi:PUA-like domain-containing protein, partial [Hygrophoropsis aurantiaca]